MKRLFVDTPTNDSAAAELISWIGQKNIKAVVITHFHIDCLGGLGEFHANGINSFSTHQTIALAKKNKEQILPQHGFGQEMGFQIGDEVVFAKYVGEGHTRDNIIGYVPIEKVLFGGCLIKQMSAPMGYLADANTAAWYATVEKIRKEFPELAIVIPGHGKHGGVELLDYTANLFREAKER